MEIRNASQPALKPVSKGALWTGRIVTGLVILFFLFDAITKIIRESHSVKGSVDLGWPDHAVSALGVTLLICTIFYIIPRTAILGAILITGYLGGAISVMVIAGQPFYFPIIFGLLVWLGIYVRDEKLREMLPFRKG